MPRRLQPLGSLLSARATLRPLHGPVQPVPFSLRSAYKASAGRGFGRHSPGRRRRRAARFPNSAPRAVACGVVTVGPSGPPSRPEVRQPGRLCRIAMSPRPGYRWLHQASATVPRGAFAELDARRSARGSSSGELRGVRSRRERITRPTLPSLPGRTLRTPYSLRPRDQRSSVTGGGDRDELGSLAGVRR